MFPSHFDFSASVRHALVKADLIHQLINTLNPQSLSFEEAEDIHINIMAIIDHSLHPATPIGLTQMPIKSADDEQDVHETVLKQVLVPSEEYICHLCVNRCLIMDDDLSHEFMLLLAEILRICPYNQQTMALLFRMPVILTIPSCLTFFEYDEAIWNILFSMVSAQREWNIKGGEVGQMGTTMNRMLRMEGIEDVMEEKLQNDKNSQSGQWVVDSSIRWNNLLGINRSQCW